MKITITGKHGAGKTSVAKILAEKLNLKFYHTGQMMRDIAKERKISLLEICELAKTDISIDKEIDEKVISIGEKEDDFIFDSKIAFQFIPDSIKIFLDIDSEIAAQRIFAHKREDEKENKSLELTQKNIKKRLELEGRWKKIYNVDYHDKNNYDIIINTSNLTIGETAEKILKKLENATI
ncbi:MAG: (d)CMP kinase [archaeon]